MSQAGTRDRMVETALRLFRRQGYAATSWRGLVEEARTPWGSVTHHFPGGKEELALAAVARGSDGMLALIEGAFASATPAQAVTAWCELSARLLEASDFRDGCPIATMALEAPRDAPRVRAAAGAAFEAWQAALVRHFVAAKMPKAKAVELAALVLINVEGALVVARATRSVKPLELAARTLSTLLRRARS